MNTPEIRQALIVDDEKTLAWAMRECFEEQGMSVTTATAGNEAMKRLDEKRFDLVITDLKMPDLSGIDVARRARELNPDAAVLILTAYGSFESAVEALRLGVDDYLAKPFKLDTLTRAVQAALTRRERLAARKDVPGEPQGTEPGFRTLAAGEMDGVLAADAAPGLPGEFFNIFQTGPNRCAAFAGRVAAEPSAGPLQPLASLVSGFLSAGCLANQAPEELLAGLQRYWTSAAPRGAQAHIFCGLFDLRENTLRYCLAGGVRVLLHHFKSQTLSPVPAGPAFPSEAARQPAVLNLQSGDQLVLLLSPPSAEAFSPYLGEQIQHALTLRNMRAALPVRGLLREAGFQTGVVTLGLNRLLPEDRRPVRLELDAENRDIVWEAKALVEQLARQIGLSPSRRHALVTAVLEIVTNSLMHAYEEKKDKILLEFQLRDGLLTVSVQDFGRGFDLRTYHEPAVDTVEGILDPDSRRGLFIAHQCVDKLEIASSPKTGTVVKLVQAVGREN